MNRAAVRFHQDQTLHAMRGCFAKLPNFSALRGQNETSNVDSPSELVIPSHNDPTSSLQQIPPSSSSATTKVERSSSHNRRSPSYCCCQPIPEYPTKKPRRAGDVENFQPPNVSVVDSVHFTAEQIPEEQSIPPVIEMVWPLNRECVI